jgi:guanyl-specific ribonuclease Sa
MRATRTSWMIVAVGLALACGIARGQQAEVRARFPAKVDRVLKAIDETGKAPAGYIGGRPYENHARRGEQPLPRVDRDGDSITYQTWDVNPEVPGRGRGAERLVTGSDGSAYYTPDDYKTFVTVRNPARSHHGGPDRANEAPPPPVREPPRREPERPVAKPRAAEKPVVALEPRVAAKVMPVLEYVLAHGEPMPGYVGGREYRNLGLDDGEVLPRTDAQGRPIRYREWDVNRKVPGRNRGAERLITGSDGRAYYTDDHYATFRRIR